MRTHEYRELTELERFTFNYFLGCMDGKVSFALIGSQTIMMLDDVTRESSKKTIRGVLEEAVDETLSNPPDFSTILMDDGYGIVVVGKLGIVTGVKLEENSLKDGKMDFRVAVALRDAALDTCEEAELIAVAFPD